MTQLGNSASGGSGSGYGSASASVFTDVFDAGNVCASPTDCNSNTNTNTNTNINITSGSGSVGNGNGNGNRRRDELVDVDALLARCAGVGNPEFAFDVEGFRGALKGIVDRKGMGGGGRV